MLRMEGVGQNFRPSPWLGGSLPIGVDLSHLQRFDIVFNLTTYPSPSTITESP